VSSGQGAVTASDPGIFACDYFSVTKGRSLTD
jgi:hypothetical protein